MTGFASHLAQKHTLRPGKWHFYRVKKNYKEKKKWEIWNLSNYDTEQMAILTSDCSHSSAAPLFWKMSCKQTSRDMVTLLLFNGNVVSLGRTPRWAVCETGSGEEKALLYHTMSFCLFRIFWFRSRPTKCYFLTNLTFFCYYFYRLHGQLVNVSMAIIDSFLWMKTDFSIHRQRLHSSFLVLKYF